MLKGHKYVAILEDCPKVVAQRVRATVVKHKCVIDEGLGALPLAVKGGVVSITLKDNTKPQ